MSVGAKIMGEWICSWGKRMHGDVRWLACGGILVEGGIRRLVLAARRRSAPFELSGTQPNHVSASLFVTFPNISRKTCWEDKDFPFEFGDYRPHLP